MPVLRFVLFGQQVAVACDDDDAAAAFGTLYGAFAAPDGRPAEAPSLSYVVGRSPSGAFLIRGPAEELPCAEDIGMLLFHLEKDLTVELQKRRRDLYFLHAAALERHGRAVLLVAESGGGKSTTAWGLLHHGFRYASDELAPIDLQTREVHGFPHALCVKADPPPPYPLPAGALRTSRTRHVPVGLLPSALAPSPLPLGAIVFVRYRPGRGSPALGPMRPAEAAARLYVQALNPLAHPADGLDAALHVVDGTPCFGLEASDLAATCELLVRTLPA